MRALNLLGGAEAPLGGAWMYLGCLRRVCWESVGVGVVLGAFCAVFAQQLKARGSLPR